MALSASPRKVVPLAGGDDWPARAPSVAQPSVTKRVFFCGVVMENIGPRQSYSQDIQDLVASLGDPLRVVEEAAPSQSDGDVDNEVNSSQPPQTRKRAMTDSSAFTSVLTELVSTERSYVQRLRILKNDYADPLRKFARNKDTAILPLYEAKTLFGNVDQLLPVNEAFLADLEQMLTPDGPQTVGGVGDVALRHFRDLKGFDNYKVYYTKREEAQTIFEREVSKKSSGFASFIDHIKYSSADVKNRVGLRELLMEPVQRIPRYTLLFRTMTKHMTPGDPQRALLIEAEEVASKIAHAEMDEHTKRAAVIHCLCATVDNFPPGLYSNNRRFIDCIDVEDLVTESFPSATSAVSSSSGVLNCTLLLFDDKIVILKRPGGSDKSGRTLAGLDELEKVSRSGGLPLGMKKNGLSCKGVVDITDVVATDVGPSEFHLYLENPPVSEGDKWSGRSFRPYTVVYPPSPANLVPTKTESAKRRFLENLWEAQAMFRTKLGQSVVLRTEDQEVEAKRNRITFARTYFNVYQRTPFLKEAKKPKVVVHIDELGHADPLPLSAREPPFVVIRIQPMAGELSRYSVTSSDPNDDNEEEIVHTARVSDRIVHTIHQYGLFKFRTGKDSAPATPSTTRSRAGIFGLDVISRNFFNSKAGPSMSDIFGGSVASRRTRSSIVSRSNTTASTATTRDGSIAKFSQRSRSTAATSVYDEDASVRSKPRSISRSRKLFKRGKSPSLGTESDYDPSPSRLSRSVGSYPRASSEEPDLGYSDGEEEAALSRSGPDVSSEWDLKMRLDLARQNSQAQTHLLHTRSMSEPADAPVYEDPPPEALRPQSGASRDTASYRSVTPTPGQDEGESPVRPVLQPSSSNDRRPIGPRAPSPLPPQSPSSDDNPLPGVDIDLPPEDSDMRAAPRSIFPSTPGDLPLELRSPIPRSRRMPFDVSGVEATPKGSATNTSIESKSSAVTPLQIKKKTSLRDESPIRRSNGRDPPLLKTTGRTRSDSASRIGTQLRPARSEPLRSGDDQPEIEARVQRLAEATKLDLDSTRSVVKRIKLDISHLQQAPRAEPSSPTTDSPRTPVRNSRLPLRAQPPVNKAAQERMAEMHALIAKRAGTAHVRTRSMSEEAPSSPSADSYTKALRSLEDAAFELDSTLTKSASNYEQLVEDMHQLVADNKAKAAQISALMDETNTQRLGMDLLKKLNAEAYEETKAIFEEANEQLAQLWEDVQLPPEESWAALSNDLRNITVAKHDLHVENSRLKRKLAELGQSWEDDD